MSLDYGYTCPTLDKYIDEAKDIIFDHIQSTVLENNPYLCEYDLPQSIKTYIKEDADALYDRLEDLFESCRTINEDIRSTADKQIEDLERQIEDLEYELKEMDNV